MLSATATKGKSRTAIKTSVVTFDATRHRNRPNGFGAGLTPATRWTGQHAYAPFDQEDADWAAAIFLEANAAEIDAEEHAYHEMLDAMALEDECVSRLERGLCL